MKNGSTPYATKANATRVDGQHNVERYISWHGESAFSPVEVSKNVMVFRLFLLSHYPHENFV